MTATAAAAPRKADYPVEPQFLKRWSPRAFNGAPISDADLHSLFEAARWAPSASNTQPWRFFYGVRDTAAFGQILDLLAASNQIWAKNAGVLMILASQRTFTPAGRTEPVESRSHSFDAGAAWGFLALQALHLGYAAHAMGGFDAARSHRELAMPADFHPEAAVAVGRVGDRSILPEALREREQPNGRVPQSDFIFEGGFKGG